MQRAVADLSALRATDARLRAHGCVMPHGRETFIRWIATPREPSSAGRRSWTIMPSCAWTGDGVHEIPVGPVHAGIIEPGHFRFSVVGEKVLRLEERLGYVHKGIERRFTQMPLARRPPAGRAVSRRLGRRLFLGLLPGAGRHGRRRAAPAGAVAARAGLGIGAPRQSSGRPRRARQRCRLRLRPRAVLAAQGTSAAGDGTGARAALSHGFRGAGRHAPRSSAAAGASSSLLAPRGRSRSEVEHAAHHL